MPAEDGVFEVVYFPNTSTSVMPTVWRYALGRLVTTSDGTMQHVLEPLLQRQFMQEDATALGIDSEWLGNALIELRGQARRLPHVLEGGTPIRGYGYLLCREVISHANA